MILWSGENRLLSSCLVSLKRCLKLSSDDRLQVLMCKRSKPRLDCWAVLPDTEDLEPQKWRMQSLPSAQKLHQPGFGSSPVHCAASERTARIFRVPSQRVTVLAKMDSGSMSKLTSYGYVMPTRRRGVLVNNGCPPPVFVPFGCKAASGTSGVKAANQTVHDAR